ncbi:AAA family ATPase [Fodinicola acaciae]|uniref:AAA family ATPase n=1 Tax=Fodinicola acaciae TaxID=2681555 RepID=UPI0013D66245
MIAAAGDRLVARRREAEVVAAALGAGRNILLEGPPGTGKTTLLTALAAGAGLPLVLVEGNAELTPARLAGHHDPSRVLTEDYHEGNFVPGPLLRAMTGGALLYVEELNRIPEETLNLLLGVLSERQIHLPRVGTVPAEPTFRLIAAMNPYDAIGTTRITPALYDRSCRVAMGYQDEDAELAIVRAETGTDSPLARQAVRAVRATRTHPEIRVPASVRGAIDTVLVARELSAIRDTDDFSLDAALAALTGRITLVDGNGRTAEEVVTEIWEGSSGKA